MIRNHTYPLAPDLSLDVNIDEHGRLVFAAEQPELLAEPWSWFLEVEYQATSRNALPAIVTWSNGQALYTQYFEAGQAGKRLLSLTGVREPGDVRIELQRCCLIGKTTLLGFRARALEQDGPVLIVAPHPDDAELAAFGLYRKQKDNVWIVTVTAGETQKRLDRQYIPSLDKDSKSAGRRKGMIRSWNSATTPLLAGVPFERNIMLGYFNDTLPALLADPASRVPSTMDEQLRPGDFRGLNRMALSTDPAPENCGEHLLRDLQALIEHIKPGVLVVTHPEVDPHPDHVATARACALAMQQSSHRPRRVLMYANHLAGERGFPRGPAHAAAGIWPWNRNDSVLGSWQLYSEYLDMELQREKVLALDSMHDLRASLKLDKRLKRWFRRLRSGVPLAEWKDYGAHDYFQTHIKAHEVFAVVSATAFIAGLV
ncbi:PIG-L deacetylase family protein [Oceanimonas sp. MB9]|uniref:PIG-L deacetylase family protein n=1 Tax=Oceanimonas sp. MB9 TaxID=2588453 RepID=UPI0013F61163|nr:PIG-L family deacetylase [Oceanimonas sp. MB9]NHH99072.1 hypothetical protein [Oceanimonas sp. MB9]